VTGKYLAYVAWFLVAGATAASGQTWDTSGNSQLNGNYYFREVVWQGQYDSTNDLQFAASVYGTISFDGQGHYTISNAQEYDSNNFTATPYSLSQPGAYSVAASGYGFMDSLINSGDSVNLLLSNGVLVGSSTDNSAGYNDIFIASPVSSNPSFQGAYTVVGMDAPTLGVADTRSYTFPLTATGTSGNLGTLRLSGYFAFSGTAAQDSLSGVNFSFSNGAAVMHLSTGELTSTNVDSHFTAGTKYFYLSPDGNFFFGGSPIGWDMIVGVKQSSTATLNSLYYLVGLTQDDSPASSGYVNLNSGYGAVNFLSNGLELEHQRVLLVSPGGGGPFDYTYSDAVSSSGGSISDSFTQFWAGPNGKYAIGLAKQPGLGIEVLVQAPSATPGQGVYIYPTGIVNAGSAAPFTASWAPGELVSIYGSNLASTTDTNGALPTTLDGVQVNVTDENGNVTLAPIYFVSPGQINAVIPDNVTTLTASIQVVNNGAASNSVTNYVGVTAPGVFNSYTSLPAIQHSDYSMVTPSSPVQPGETILVYLTGLGQVDASGNSTSSFTASVGGVSATVAYAGTQSPVGGGYQMNIAVPPSGVTAGNVYLDISGPDTYNSETVIPFGSGSTAAAQSSPLSVRRPQAKDPAAKAHRRPSKGSPQSYSIFRRRP